LGAVQNSLWLQFSMNRRANMIGRPLTVLRGLFFTLNSAYATKW